MEQLTERLDDHEGRLKSLELTRADTLKALNDLDTKHEQRIREVKQGLEKQIEDLKRESRERDAENGKRMDRMEAKFDKFNEKLDGIRDAFSKAIKQTPPWVWPLISAILTVSGWLIGKSW